MIITKKTGDLDYGAIKLIIIGLVSNVPATEAALKPYFYGIRGYSVPGCTWQSKLRLIVCYKFLFLCLL